MGQENLELTPGEIVAAVVESIRRVVPTDVEVTAATLLSRTTLDSLGLIEMMVHLEDLLGVALDEAQVRQAVLEPEFNPMITVEAFAQQLWQLASGPRIAAS
jgi:acyl carrier protein